MAGDKVKVPAISLMVVCGIGIFFSLLSIVLNIVGVGAGSYEMMNEYSSVNMSQYMASGVSSIISNVFLIIYQGIIAYGALQMMNMRSHGLCMAAAIMAIIPCLTPCCILGTPFGIWALVVLMDDQVKPYFR